jgi:endoglycosylceramidase
MITAFSNPIEKYNMLGYLENKDFYTALAKPAEALVEQFDRGALAAFYDKITNAVRAVDPYGLIMRENSYFSNMGIECKAGPIHDESGQAEPLQAFSPHGYDLVVDTEAVVMASNIRVDVIFEAHRRAQQRLGVPVIVGEWGAFGHYADGLGHIEHLLSIFEKYLWSNTYWCYESSFGQAPVVQVLKRPYPQAVCGQLLTYRYDRQADEFYMEWEERNCDVPSVIYLPTDEFSINLSGEYNINIRENSAVLTIMPSGGMRTLAVKLGRG